MRKCDGESHNPTRAAVPGPQKSALTGQLSHPYTTARHLLASALWHNTSNICIVGRLRRDIAAPQQRLSSLKHCCPGGHRVRLRCWPPAATGAAARPPAGRSQRRAPSARGCAAPRASLVPRLRQPRGSTPPARPPPVARAFTPFACVFVFGYRHSQGRRVLDHRARAALKCCPAPMRRMPHGSMLQRRSQPFECEGRS